MRRVLPVLVVGACLLAGIAASGAGAAGAGDDGAFFDSAFDGVWVGSIAVKTTSGIVDHPVLLNLDAGAKRVGGAVLVADMFTGTPTAVEAMTVQDGTLKGKRIKFSIPLPGQRAFHPLARSAATHDFVLRLKKGSLKGKMKSKAPGLKGASKVEVFPLDAASPLQQLWVGTLDAGARKRAAGEVAALFLRQAPAISGIGFVGGSFGTVTGASLAGSTLTATLATGDGDIDLSLDLSGSMLAGTAAGVAAGLLELNAGGMTGAPKITDVTPAELPAGKTTTVTLKGQGLAAGIVLHVDHPDVYASTPDVAKPTEATAQITIPDGLPSGTQLHLRVQTPAGGEIEPDATLRSGPSAAVSFKDDLVPVFTSRCALSGCHVVPPRDDPAYDDGGTAAGNMVLTAARAYGEIVNRPSMARPELMRILPFNPADSYLIRKIRGVDLDGAARMPFDGPPFLSDEVIDMFVKWVEAGALRN